MLLELHVAALLVDDDETRRPQRFQNLRTMPFGSNVAV